MGHKSQDELKEEIQTTRGKIQINRKYYHYKQPEQYYEIVELGFLEDSEEPCVIYRSLYGEGLIWVRSLSNFLEEVESGGQKVSRFQKVNE